MIGIFDSGIGGMTVARAVERMLPGRPLLYFGDTARTPYGDKSPETIINYSLENTEFLLNKGAKLIIIACNSASSVATQRLQEEFNVPIIEVITPAVKKALTTTQNGRIGVIGTRATVKSDIYKKKITDYRGEINVFSQACSLLVPLVEEGWLNKRETKMILRRYLHPFKNHQIDTLILGCTHYPLLSPLIQARIGKKVTLIDSSVEAANVLKNIIMEQPDLSTGSSDSSPQHAFYVSDLTEAAVTIAAQIFGRKMEILQK
jgi:glutamate racemase